MTEALLWVDCVRVCGVRRPALQPAVVSVWLLSPCRVMEYVFPATRHRKKLWPLMDEVWRCAGVWLLTGSNQSVRSASVKLIIWKCKQLFSWAVYLLLNHKHSNVLRAISAFRGVQGKSIGQTSWQKMSTGNEKGCFPFKYCVYMCYNSFNSSTSPWFIHVDMISQ